MSKETVELLLKIMPFILVGISVGFFILELLEVQKIKKLNKRVEYLKKEALLQGIPAAHKLNPLKLNKSSLVISSIFLIVSFSHLQVLDSFPIMKYLKMEFAKLFQTALKLFTP